MELKKRCTCAGLRSDWISRHSFSVNESLAGLLFIPHELLADGFGKGKDNTNGSDGYDEVLCLVYEASPQGE